MKSLDEDTVLKSRTSRKKWKLEISKIIAGSHNIHKSNDYEEILNIIYENQYRCILKCPSNIFLLGIVDMFVTNLEKANFILSIIKEVVKDALEVSGIELTFTDSDWSEIKLQKNTYKFSKEDYEFVKNDEVFNFTNNKKSYMSNFFEL